MTAILKRHGEVTAAAKREVKDWDARHLRDFLAYLAAGGANRKDVMDDAAEALAYLRWRANRRFKKRLGDHSPRWRPQDWEGGWRCDPSQTQFVGDDPIASDTFVEGGDS